MEKGTSIHAFVLGQHGHEALKKLRKLEKTTKQLSHWINHRIYNIRCKRAGFTPKNISVKTSIRGIRADKEIKTAEKRLLEIQIDHCSFTIKKLEDRLGEERVKFNDAVTVETVNRANDYLLHMRQRNFDVMKEKQIRKFNQMRERRAETTAKSQQQDENITKRWVINNSSFILSKPQEKLLARGLNFAITPNK